MTRKKTFILLGIIFCVVATYSAQLMISPKADPKTEQKTKSKPVEPAVATAVSQWPVYVDTIEVKVGSDHAYGNAYVVDLLPKRDLGKFKLPVVIGSCEARGIEDAKFGSESPRPMTYDLFSKILAGIGGKISAVVISKLEGGVYYADLLVESNGNKLLFDARPSDAMNLALRSKAPIYVAKKVWTEAKEPTE